VDRDEQRRIVEALVVASREPLAAAQIGSVLPEGGAARVRELVAELNREYREQGRAFEIEEVGGGYQMRTRIELAPYLAQLRTQRALRLSQAALETLAIVAYRQPLTRAEIEHVRGVECGAVLRTLIEHRLVRIAGHRDVPGRPLLYGTTKRFLEVFALASLADLPTLREVEELLGERSERAAPGAGDVEEISLADVAERAASDPADETEIDTPAAPETF
jgi:segregation and condensation protein B